MSEQTAGNFTRIINWLIPILLVIAALGLLIFYPSSERQPENRPETSPRMHIDKQTTGNTVESIADILISRYFNGSEEDISAQKQALLNTLNYIKTLHNSQNDKTATSIITHLKQGNIHAAIKNLIVFADNNDNPREAAKLWISIGNIQNLTSASQALQAYQKASDLDPGNSNAWNRQGHIYRQLKQFDKAEKAYKKVQQLTNLGATNQATSYANFGLLNQSKGNFEAAEQAFLKAISIHEDTANDEGIASVSENLASLYKHTEYYKKAETYYFKALDIYDKAGNETALASSHISLGSLYQTTKQMNKAQQHLEKALNISIQNNLQGNIANLYNNLGIIAQQNNELKKSRELFEKALNINRDIKKLKGIADQYSNLAILNRTQKKYELAEDYHKKAIQLYRQMKHTDGVNSQQINLGFLYKSWQKPEAACQIWKESLNNLSRNGNNRAARVRQLIHETCQ